MTDHTRTATAAEAAGEVKRKARDEAAELVRTAKAEGKQAGESVKDTGARALTVIKDEAAERVSGIARVFRSAKDARAGEQTSLGTVLEPLAATAERVADYLKACSGEELMSDLRSASQRQPLLTFAGVFAVGMAAAYLAKQVLLDEGDSHGA